MNKKVKIVIVTLLFLAAFALFLFFVSSHDIAVLNPKGFIAKQERDLMIATSLLMLIVVVPVIVFTLVFAWRYRADNDKAKYTPEWEHSNLAETIWWGVPLLIIIILAVITWRTSHELNPFKPLDSDKKPVEIQAVALEWKWLFIYPEQGIATLNYITFPENTPINFQITAQAPMNSFWIPALAGQIYAMPGMRSKIHLIADEKGIYRGRSSSFSGKGFSGMTFKAKVTSKEEFENWVERAQDSGNILTLDEYKSLAKPSSYDVPATYRLSAPNLFERIIMQYKAPENAM